jgi:DNA-binding transcriptional LysR family regulator
MGAELNVKRLAVFRAVVAAGSVSAAARRLYISQPAVTKTVRLLEEEVGLPLFLRVNGRLVLTPEAEALIPQIERLFANVGAVRHLADEIRDGFSGSLSVATVTTLSATLVAQAVRVFHAQYPRVRFDIKALSTRHVVDAVVGHQVDLGVVDVPTSGVDLEIVELCRAEIGCVVRNDHPFARKTRLGPQDIAGETLISFSEETYTGWQLREAFQRARVSGQVTFTVNHAHTAYALVQAGIGIGIVDSFAMLTGVFSDLTIRPFRPVIRASPQVVFSKTHAVPLVARNFAVVLQSVMAGFIASSGGMLKPPTGGRSADE